MATFTFEAAKARRPAVQGSTSAGGIVLVPFVGALGAAWATNDQIKFCKLPKQHLPFDLIIDWPDMDSGANLVYDVGLYEDSGVDTTVGTVVDTDAFLAASTVARAVGRERIGNALQAALAAVQTVSDSDRIVVATATTGGATAHTGSIRGYLLCRPAGYDD